MDFNICFNCMEKANGDSSYCAHCGMPLGKIESSDTTSLKIGTILRGRYLVGKKLGQGGFGITYMGFDLVLSCKVAIKEYYPMGRVSRNSSVSSKLIWKTAEDYEEGCHNILREAQKIAKVNSIPNVVSVHDTFEENNTAYIVMDFIPGITLKAKIAKDGVMSFKECFELLKPVFTGLKKLHEQDIIHRDISPDNIMINENNEPYLLDMGAARDISSRVSEPIGVAKHGYSPIEQYNTNSEIGPWVDVYALSATIFYCISGKVLTSSIERANTRNIDFSLVKGKLSKTQKSFLEKGLEPDYRKRTQSVEEFITYDEGKNSNNSIKTVGLTVLALAVIGVLVAFLGGISGEKIEYMGNSNSNTLMGAGKFLQTRDDFYFIDAYNDFYHHSIDRKTDDGGIIDFTRKTLIDEYSLYLTASKDGPVYYLSYDEETEKEQLKSYDAENEKTDVIYESDYALYSLRYVLTNRNKEYLYFLKDEDEEGSKSNLYMYDIGKDKLTLICENVLIFSLSERNIFFVKVINDEEILSCSAELNGSKQKPLKENTDAAVCGCTDEMLLMEHMDETMQFFFADFNGTEIKDTVFSQGLSSENHEHSGLSEVFIYTENDFAYDNKYFYYFEDGKIIQKAIFGTEEKVLFKNIKDVENINIQDHLLYLEIDTIDGNSSSFILPVYPSYENENYDINDEIRLYEDGKSYYVIPKDELDYDLVDDEYVIINEYKPTNDSETEYVTLPEHIDTYPVKIIGDGAFEESEIENFLCPDTLEVIYQNAFKMSQNLKKIHFNEGLLGIGSHSLLATAVEEIRLPDSFREVQFGGFNSFSIKSFYVSSGNQHFSVENGVLFSKDKKVLVSYPYASTRTTYEVPDGVEEIGIFAFAGSNLNKVVLPSSVKKIGESAFTSSKISSIYIPSGTQEIGKNAFSNASNLKSVTINKSFKGRTDIFDSGTTVSYYS